MTQLKEAVEMLPCPFCGGDPFFWEGEVAHGNYLICCKNCECQIHLAKEFFVPEDCGDEYYDFMNKEALAKQWNTRAALSPVAKPIAGGCCKNCSKDVCDGK